MCADYKALWGKIVISENKINLIKNKKITLKYIQSVEHYWHATETLKEVISSSNTLDKKLTLGRGGGGIAAIRGLDPPHPPLPWVTVMDRLAILKHGQGHYTWTFSFLHVCALCSAPSLLHCGRCKHYMCVCVCVCVGGGVLREEMYVSVTSINVYGGHGTAKHGRLPPALVTQHTRQHIGCGVFDVRTQHRVGADNCGTWLSAASRGSWAYVSNAWLAVYFLISIVVAWCITVASWLQHKRDACLRASPGGLRLDSWPTPKCLSWVFLLEILFLHDVNKNKIALVVSHRNFSHRDCSCLLSQPKVRQPEHRLERDANI